MKVLYYHQYFSTPAGSAGTRSYALARSLVEAGHQVQMVCLQDARTHSGLSGPFTAGRRSGLVCGIEVIEFDLPYSSHAALLERALVFLRYSWQSTRLALRSDADLIFATTTPLTAGIPGIAARWLRGIPFVFEVRDLWPELPRAMGVVRNPLVLRALSVLEWCSYHSADACIGLAPGICEGIADRDILPSQITSIPNGCDLDLFYPLPPPQNKQPDLITGVADGSFVAAFTGAHGQANGLDALLDLAAELLSRGRHDIQLLFVGDGPCKPALVQRAADENLHNCHFLRLVPKHQLAKMLRQSVHVGLMVLADVPAFYRGTSPNKFFDYLACGLPVVNNYSGWLADLIQSHELGVAVAPRDPKAFADALIALADDPVKYRAMSTNARELAESKFSRVALAGQWLQVLENVDACYGQRRRGFVIRSLYRILKRGADCIAAFLALLLLFPLLIAVAILIQWRLGHPVLFRQQRPGYNGKPFWLLKFRTMTNARDSSGDLLPDAQRLTPFGLWLRATSIDELPSLINIFLGEMSFVGPRPFIIKHDLYEKEFLDRFLVLPGLTGWAQVNGRNSIPWKRKFELDCWYVRNISFRLDFSILLKTLFVLFDRRSVSADGHATFPEFKK